MAVPSDQATKTAEQQAMHVDKAAELNEKFGSC
jgi:hypothetical protein